MEIVTGRSWGLRLDMQLSNTKYVDDCKNMYEKSERGPFKPNRTVDADRHACQLPLNNFTTPMLNKRYIKQRILHTDAPYVVSRSHQRSKRSFARSYRVRNK